MIELNKVYNENCLHTMARMPEGFVDLTVTSPPYDNLRSYKGYSFPFEQITKELFRVTKPGGVVVWVVGDATKNGTESGTSFRQALYFMECGFNLHDTMIYEKENPVPLSHNRYEQAFEYMFVFSKGKPGTTNILLEPALYAGQIRNHNSGNRMGAGGETSSSFRLRDKKTIRKEFRQKKNIWKYKIGGGLSTKDKIAFQHPAIFPEKLAEDHILSWSNEDDIVFDPMAGSGTVPKMAIKNKRRWIASETSSEYCGIIEKRIGL